MADVRTQGHAGQKPHRLAPRCQRRGEIETCVLPTPESPSGITFPQPVSIDARGESAKSFADSAAVAASQNIAPAALRVGLTRYFDFYNARRRHTALDRRTPDAVYFDEAAQAAMFETRVRREVVSDTVTVLLQRAAARRQAALNVPQAAPIDPRPLEHGRVQ